MESISPNQLFFTQFEPKMQRQFFFRLGTTGIPHYFVKQAGRPTYSFNVIELPHINTTRKVKGKVEFDSIDLTLYDPISPSGTQQVMEWVRRHHEATTGVDGYATTYKEDVTYNTLDPQGNKIEEWTLKGAFIESFEPSEADFEGEDHEISMTLAYDYPILQY